MAMKLEANILVNGSSMWQGLIEKKKSCFRFLMKNRGGAVVSC